MNEYFVGDNLTLLKKVDNNSVDLIYFDPPYNTGRDWGDFKDKFESMRYFRETFLRPRILECKRVLKKTGSIVVHVNPTISHHVRVLLDEIFGISRFINEVVWVTSGNAKNKRKMNKFHDTLVCYSKVASKYTFNPIYKPYDNDYKKRCGVKVCEFKNKEYNTTAIHNSRPDTVPRTNLRYEWNGHHKQWYVSKEKMKALHDDNRLVYNKLGIPRIKRYLHEMEGIPIRDVWDDIPSMQLKEKLNYATQKPVALLERVLTMFSNKGDIVLDIFAGSGTTGRACIALSRKYILFDINEKGKKVFLKSIGESNDN